MSSAHYLPVVLLLGQEANLRTLTLTLTLTLILVDDPDPVLLANIYDTPLNRIQGSTNSTHQHLHQGFLS
jgi:hypothetical protein